jgi:hypothetical protein
MPIATTTAKLPVEEVIDNTVQLHLGIERSLSPLVTHSSNASLSTEIRQRRRRYSRSLCDRSRRSSMGNDNAWQHTMVLRNRYIADIIELASCECSLPIFCTFFWSVSAHSSAFPTFLLQRTQVARSHLFIF